MPSLWREEPPEKEACTEHEWWESDRRLCPLLSMVAWRGEKANMAYTALIGWKAGHSHWLWHAWDLGEDFWKTACWKAKNQLVLCPPPGRGMSMVTSEQRPGGTDYERCLKLDNDWKPAKPPTFMILLGGKRGSWCNLELSWKRLTGWFFFGCLRGDGLSGRDRPLFPETLVIIDFIWLFSFLCYFQFLNLCSSCNDKYLSSYLWYYTLTFSFPLLLLPRYFRQKWALFQII